MKILFLAPYLPDTAPSQRYRLEQWQPYLGRLGATVTHAAFVSRRLQEVLYLPGRHMTKAREMLGGLRRRWNDVRRAREYDLVFVHREASLIGPALFERMIKRKRVPMVFEMDDAVYVPYSSPSNKWLSRLKFPGKTRRICELSDHVIVGSRFLAEYALKYNPNVTIIPTTVDTEVYRPFGSAPPGLIRIGWCGSHSTTRYLRTLMPALHALRERKEFRLLFVGASRFEVSGVETEFREWVSENEVRDLADMSIGVMPVSEEEWARGKQGLKALLYMAMEIPVVASPVGANREIIKDGENGFLAADREEWVSKLDLLLEDPGLRLRLGKAGRKTVQEQYAAHVHAPRVMEVFRQLVSRTGTRNGRNESGGG